MQTRFQRSADMAYRAAAGDDGGFEMVISTEAPYERFFGIEILRHTADAVDLSRLADGRHPLLLGHDTEKQIGVIDRAWIDEQRQLRGAPRFSRSTLGQEIEQDVKDKIRTLVSVGYFIDEIEEVEKAADGTETTIRRMSGDEFEREMRATHGDSWHRAGPSAGRAKDSTPPTFVVTRWQPFEASVVPVPADCGAGFGKSAGVEPEPEAVPAVVAPTPSKIRIVKESKMSDPKTPAELEIERRDRIAALAEQYAKYLKPADGSNAVRSMQTVDQFIEFIMQRMQSAHTDTSAIVVGLSPKEVRKYSFSKALVAQMTGDWREAALEREASEAMGKIMGRQAEGFFVPPEVFKRDFNVGTAAEAGNLVATDLRSDLFTDVLRNNLVMTRLGARVLSGLSGNIDIPRKITASTIGTTSEVGSASETAPATAKVTLSPKRATAFVEVSKQALIQSGMSLEAMIRDDLLQGVAVHIESQCLNGVGSTNQMTGIRNTSSIGTVVGGTHGLAPAWSHFVDLESACANSNAEPDRLAGYLLNTKTRGKLKQTQLGTNLPFIWQNGGQPVNGYRAEVSNNVPSNITKGTSTTVCSAALFGSDWSMATIGLFGAPDITVDPYSKADTGQVKITLNQFADFGVRQPACFAKIEDLLAG
jgi:HK97 family phage major capsid protein